MILNALARTLKRQARGDFRGRHFEATLIVQAVSWYLRYALRYRDIEEMFLERGLTVDHSTINRWVHAYAPAIERRLRRFRMPHCGSVRVDETYIRVRGQWRYLYRAVDEHGDAVDFLLTADRGLEREPLVAAVPIEDVMVSSARDLAWMRDWPIHAVARPRTWPWVYEGRAIRRTILDWIGRHVGGGRFSWHQMAPEHGLELPPDRGSRRL